MSSFGSYVAAKKQHKEAGSSGDRVRVYCRLRPILVDDEAGGAAGGSAFLTAPSDDASAAGRTSCIQQHDDKGDFTFRKESGEVKHFQYDGQ